jgi:aryl-alcohol dehydrogenase-like predicted oxidoreductase
MKIKLLGKSGLRVSELALGTMTFGTDWGWGADKETARQIFNAYNEAGGNFIDTSCNYTGGTAERFIGEFVASRRDDFVIGTKYSLRKHDARPNDLNAGGNHRKNLRRSIEASLARMGTDYVDILWLHIWDGTTPVEEVLRTLDDLVRAGKVLYVGISDSPAWVAAYSVAVSELRGWPRFIGYQGEYNLIQRGAEREILPMTHALDMAFLAFGLLEGGILSGKFNRGEQPKDTRVRRPSEAQMKVAETVIQVANEIGYSPAQVAVNWVRQQGANVIPIVGARSLEQMRENLGSLDFHLPADAMAGLSAALPPSPEYPDSFYLNESLLGLAFGAAREDLINHRT